MNYHSGMKHTDKYDKYFYEATEAYWANVPELVCYPEFFKAQAIAESNLKPKAVSPAGAIGIMQIMPETARGDFGMKDTDQLFNAETSIWYGTHYMKKIWEYWKDINVPEERFEISLASYNAGLGNVRRAFETLSEKEREYADWAMVAERLHLVTGNHSKETLRYVARVKAIRRELIEESGRFSGVCRYPPTKNNQFAENPEGENNA